jgi:hypothetical protein
MAGVLFGRKVNPEMIWVRHFFIGVGVKKWLYRMPNVIWTDAFPPATLAHILSQLAHFWMG